VNQLRKWNEKIPVFVDLRGFVVLVAVWLLRKYRKIKARNRETLV